MKKNQGKEQLLLEISEKAVNVSYLRSSITQLSTLITQTGEAEERVEVAKRAVVRNELVLKALVDRPLKPIKVLRAFAWLCGTDARADAEATIRDLELDRQQMVVEGHTYSFVAGVITWRVFWFILRVAADGVWRIIRPKPIPVR